MTKEQREQYVRQLCKDKGYDETKTAKVVAKAHADAEGEDGSLFDELYELPIKSSSDYNRKVDELKTKATALDKWHTTAQETVNKATSQAKGAQDRLAKYEAKFGAVDDLDIDDDGSAKGKGGKTVSAKVVEDMLAARDQQRNLEALQIVADSGDIVARHFALTGKIISTRELLLEVGKAAQTADAQGNPIQITIEQAYQNLHGEEVKAISDKRAADDKQALIAQGAKEERARLQKAGYRVTGAAISESGSNGIAFDAINSEGKKDDKVRQLSEDDRLALFAQEIRQENDKVEAAEANT